MSDTRYKCVAFDEAGAYAGEPETLGREDARAFAARHGGADGLVSAGRTGGFIAYDAKGRTRALCSIIGQRPMRGQRRFRRRGGWDWAR